MADLQIIQTFKDHLQHYTEEQLRYKPADDSWSLCQLYCHLIDVSLEYLEKMEACAKGDTEQPLGKTQAGELVFSLGAFPPIKIKLPALPENTPSNTEAIASLDAGLKQVQQMMAEWSDKVATVHPNGKAKHNGFGWLNAQEWYDLVTMHFQHHLRQKEELE
ncbi:DinB family protein [Brevibacillus migulae]|uniref:DinB family protein n=1 Tax=Brevibacillus migulae TaxID=1644114 RepID=UPI00106E4304|nr:DinB family protein [Brevibacillus migulae]